MVPFFEAKTTHTHGRSAIITHEGNWKMLEFRNRLYLQTVEAGIGVLTRSNAELTTSACTIIVNQIMKSPASSDIYAFHPRLTNVRSECCYSS